MGGGADEQRRVTHQEVLHADNHRKGRYLRPLRPPRTFGQRRWVLVADRAIADAGLLEQLIASAGAATIGTTCLVEVNPGLAATARFAEASAAAACDVVLAVGGGSALCAAKAVAILLTNIGQSTSTRASAWCRTSRPRRSRSQQRLALAAATRCRTRSCSTRPPCEVVVRGPGYEPPLAILDGTLLRMLPAQPRIEAALDALTPALEARWVPAGRSSPMRSPPRCGRPLHPTPSGARRAERRPCHLYDSPSRVGEERRRAPFVPLRSGFEKFVARLHERPLQGRRDVHLGTAPRHEAAEVHLAHAGSPMQRDRDRFLFHEVRDSLKIERGLGLGVVQPVSVPDRRREHVNSRVLDELERNL